MRAAGSSSFGLSSAWVYLWRNAMSPSVAGRVTLVLWTSCVVGSRSCRLETRCSWACVSFFGTALGSSEPLAPWMASSCSWKALRSVIGAWNLRRRLISALLRRCVFLREYLRRPFGCSA